MSLVSNSICQSGPWDGLSTNKSNILYKIMHFNICINRKYAIGFENDIENGNNNIQKFIFLRIVKLVFLEYFNSQYMLYLVSFL